MRLPRRGTVSALLPKAIDRGVYTDGLRRYWDEVKDASDIRASPVWNPDNGFGGDGTGPDGCVADGPFSNLTLRFDSHFHANHGYCLSRNFNPEAFHAAGQANVEDCMGSADWERSSVCWENFVHTAGHDGTGRVVNDPTATPHVKGSVDDRDRWQMRS